jgi:hypothetical protein
LLERSLVRKLLTEEQKHWEIREAFDVFDIDGFGALPGRLKVSLRAGRRNRDSACAPGAPCPRARTVAGFPRQFSPGDRERMGSID